MQRHLFKRAAFTAFATTVFFSHKVFANTSEISNLSEISESANTLLGKLDGTTLFNTLLSGIPDFLKEISVSFGISFAIIVIATLFSTVKDNLSIGTDVFEIISSSLIILSTVSTITMCFLKVQTHLSRMCAYMLAFVPISSVMHASSGNTITAAATNTSMILTVTLIELISVSVILPCIRVMYAISAANTICNKINLTGITSFIKSFCLWGMGISFTVFTGIVSLKSILGTSADSLAMKSLKYSASKFIPIAGGMMSESMKTVISGISLLKNVTGITGMLFIVYTVIPPLCAILATKLCLGFLSAFSKTTNQKCSAYFDELSSCTNILSALLLGCSVSFIIMFAVFIKSTVSI